MHRQSLSQLLNRYLPTSNAEQQSKQLMLEFLENNSECFERSCVLGHFTASAFLLNKIGDKFLLLHHTKLNAWLQPGGHCDGNADVLAVAIKEAQEETGIEHIRAIKSDIFDIDIHDIPVYNNIPEHKHYDIRFLLQVVSDEPIKGNHESQDIAWFSKDQLALPTNEPSILRMFDKWLAN